MSVSPTKLILRGVDEQLRSPLTLFAIFSFIGVLTISGAFGTYLTMTLIERLTYWSIVACVGAVIALILNVSVQHFWPKLAIWKFTLVVCICFTIIYTPILWGLAHFLTAHKRAYITPLWGMYLNVFFIALIALQSQNFINAHLKKTDCPRLFRRFENPGVKQVHRLSVRNHYVDVFTDCGVETLLMRFSDAIDELEGILGKQVHRSHWVAYDAMEALERQNGKVFLVLTDGSRVPVSRTHREHLEQSLSNARASGR